MRRIFDEELNELHNQFIAMGTAVNKAVHHAVKAFIDHDVETADKVIRADKHINSTEVQIESDCFTLIALQQPVASDLRKIVAVLKSTSDLERIGDHAVSISKATITVKGNERILEIEKMLADMSDIVENMMDRVIKAYVHLDVEEARRIAEADEAVDVYLKKVVKAVTKGIQEQPSAAMGGMEYALVAGFLERIGDYITNICERIVYMVTGQILELN